MSEVTRKDVEKLKAQWTKDPCWDLYDTEGYHDFFSELWDYQSEMQHKWKEERKEKELKEQSRRGESLFGLKLGEWCEINNSSYVRVPGGWVYGNTHVVYEDGLCRAASNTCCFIPYNEEFKP